MSLSVLVISNSLGASSSDGILEKLGWTHGVDRWDGPVGWVLGLDRWAWTQGQDLNKVKTSKLLANVYLLAQ